MPIHYASIMNKHSKVVLQGFEEKSQTTFKNQVVDRAGMIKPYAYSEV